MLLGGKYFSKKVNTIRNNVESLHKLDIFLLLFISRGVCCIISNIMWQNNIYKKFTFESNL